MESIIETNNNNNNNRVAIIYTGETRTIETTIAHFKENAVLNSSCHVFACLQLPNPKDTVILSYFDTFVKDQLSESLKSLKWFDPDDPEWTAVKEETLRTITVSDMWKDYLRRSGSIIEYYQMYLAYRQIVAYELEHGVKYDYIMRIRCDVVLCHPLNFDTMFQNDEIKYPVSKEDVLLFMNTFYYPPRAAQSVVKHYGNHIISLEFQRILDLCGDSNSEICKQEFHEYFHQYFREYFREYFTKGKYMISLRNNQIYFIKREFFDPIAILGITYGTRVMPEKPHWFDAESQFQTICVHNGIDIFDSTTEMEGQSLYNYSEGNYYDSETGCLIRSPDTMFFIKRR